MGKDIKDIKEIRNIIENILYSEKMTLTKLAELSCLRHFHYNPEKFYIEEYDAKLLRSFFHNNTEENYKESLKDLFTK